MHLILRGGWLVAFVIVCVLFVLLAGAAIFTRSVEMAPAQRFGLDAYGPAQFDFREVSFDDIEDWRLDDQSAALPAFLRSCEQIEGREDAAPANPLEALGRGPATATLAGTVADWRVACERARALDEVGYADDNARRSAVRNYFEETFAPVQIIAHRPPKPEGPARRRGAIRQTLGRFTAYYEPVYPAMGFETAEFSSPVLARPDDLVMVDLGAFRADLAGRRIAGSVRDGRLVPYADHRAINDGVLRGETEVIAWMRPTDLFFMQIQGSGRLRFRSGEEMRVGYAGQNGHPYTAIGKILIEDGEVPREKMSMQAIRDWLEAAPPKAAKSLREVNASYVFFRRLEDLPAPELGPLGAGNVQLTEGRSLAVDRRYHALGAPVWVSIRDGEPGAPQGGVKRLFIAQDTGGAIRGPIRGDIYAGSGPRAGEVAGAFNAMGEMFVLVPKTASRRIAARMR